MPMRVPTLSSDEEGNTGFAMREGLFRPAEPKTHCMKASTLYGTRETSGAASHHP